MKLKLSATLAMLLCVCLLFVGCSNPPQAAEDATVSATPQTLAEYVQENEESLQQLLGISDGDDVTLTAQESVLEICYMYPAGIHPEQELLDHAAENNRLNWQEAANRMTQALSRTITVSATYQTDDGTVLASYECVGVPQQ